MSAHHYYDDKDQRKLHNYVEVHHQDADTVEEEVGNVEKMREMEEARKAAAVRSHHRRPPCLGLTAPGCVSRTTRLTGPLCTS